MSEIIKREIWNWLRDETNLETFVELGDRLQRDYPDELKKQFATISDEQRERTMKMIGCLLLNQGFV